MAYNGLVVDLGAGLTQISPVSDGYTSQCSSHFFKVTGEQADEYLYRSLHDKYSLDPQKQVPKMDVVSLYRVK